MKIIVLGGGVIGVTTAYYLLMAGHDVKVIEKNSKVGCEASFANGAQLCYSGIRALRKFPNGHNISLKQKIFEEKYLYKNDLFFEARPEFLRLLNETKINCDTNFNGVLNLFFSEFEFLRHRRIYVNKQQYGINSTFLTKQECIDKNPLLKYCHNLIGGILIHDDGIGDAYKFTEKLTEICIKHKARFHFNTTVKRLITDNDRILGCETDNGILKADLYVLALGAYSSVILSKASVENDVFPNKGYSISFDNPFPDQSFSIADPVEKIYISILGGQIRIAGLSETVGFDKKIYPLQIQKLIAKAKEILPQMNIVNHKNWTCFRSSTKNSTPIIKCSEKLSQLYINTGHGGFGWTLAPVSAKRICNLIEKNSV